ncbi:phosphate butyryltransferase [Irregularibacter muris]|uniref:Phosphate butyryltransferase n=1 Tax=Irregularibacter muris TaxID=1796619 RepID=A0AAE3KZQ4_9FIRM|nr:phosphate butyryltransferase [Irregularibacter muris]MCR1898622.1 phosphate butyryltransferase [Irregularibacter muris]
MIKSFDDILQTAQERGPKTIAVAVAEDYHVLEAVWAAKQKGIADACLVGDQEKICSIAQEIGMDIQQFEIIHEAETIEAAKKAVHRVATGKAQVLMKGLLQTADIMKAVLDREAGLRGSSILSHVAVFEVDGFERLFYVTDAAMNIAPTVEDKVKILKNCVGLANALDNQEPRVGVVCAVEKLNNKMEATLHAAELVERNKRGEIKGCIIGGPFALDNAISEEAARIKKITHPVAGKAEILLIPDIEAGNILYKSLSFFAKARNAGIIVGARAPIVLTSRADSKESKLNSIALGVLLACNQSEAERL